MFLRFDVVGFPQHSTSAPSLRFRLRSFSPSTLPAGLHSLRLLQLISASLRFVSPSHSSAVCTRLRFLRHNLLRCASTSPNSSALITDFMFLHIQFLFLPRRSGWLRTVAFRPRRFLSHSTCSHSFRLVLDIFGCVHSPSMLLRHPAIVSLYIQPPEFSYRCFRPPASYRIVPPSMSSAALNQYLSSYIWSPGVAPSGRGSRPPPTKTKHQNHQTKNQQKKKPQQLQRRESAVASYTAAAYKAKYLLQILKGSVKREYC
jgi:hypothetical protein